MDRSVSRADDDRDGDDEFDDIVDPDVDLHDAEQRPENRDTVLPVLVVIAAGGVLGAEARYGVGVALPHTSSQFPLSTLLINTTGCLLLGVLMVIVTELRSPHRLVRPFLGVGVLGGYTTFSSFAVDVQNLVAAGRATVGLAYWSLTLVAGWTAVWLGVHAARRLGSPTGSTS